MLISNQIQQKLVQISNNFTYIAGADRVLCYDYKSCQESNITNENGNTLCFGGYSCYNASRLEVIDNVGNIECHGLFACAYSSKIKSYYQKIYCVGENSCYKSTMFQNTTSDTIYCLGFGSCRESAIYLSTQIHFWGHYSGQNSIIQSEENETTVYFYDKTSGAGTNVTCNLGHTCYIECFYNGCDDVTLIENGGTFDINCNVDAFYSNKCPNGQKISNFIIDKVPSLNRVSFTQDYNYPNSDINISYDPCNSNLTNAMTCSLEKECETSTTLITIEENGGDVHLSGAWTSEQATIWTSSDSSIFCRGQESCEAVSMNHSYTRDIYCVAWLSCWYLNIEHSSSNLHVYGYIAGRQISISRLNGDIDCQGYLPCHSSTIDNVNRSVYGVGYHSLWNCSISMVNGSLIGVGYY